MYAMLCYYLILLLLFIFLFIIIISIDRLKLRYPLFCITTAQTNQLLQFTCY